MLRKIYTKVNSFIEKHILLVFLITIIIARLEDFIWFLKQVKHFLVFGLGFDKYPVMDFSNIGVFSSLLLAFVTIWLALNANKTANESKELSAKALEIERPVLKFTCTQIDESKNLQTLKIENVGKAEATDIEVFMYKNNVFEKIKITLTNLSYGISPLELSFEPVSYTTPFLVKYKNITTGKQYKQTGELRKKSNEVFQIGLDAGLYLQF